MPIFPFLHGERFDEETTRALGVAFEIVRIALQVGACDDSAKQAIADKIVALAKTGESNPDVLAEKALAAIRGGPDKRLDLDLEETPATSS